MKRTTRYDEVPYPSAIYSQTHPDGLATMGLLLGMKPAPVGHCRVLELGCGDGMNLTTMAFGLPASEFVGIDLATQPIAQGNTVIKALGLKNISLHQLDITEAPEHLGRFDYIIAHGLYSWVPEAVRDRILSLCAAHLNDQGVAYVSYNAYPGQHFRDLARGLMRFHVQQFQKPEEQIRQARAVLKFIAESKPEPDVYHLALKQELERALKYTDAGFFHDDLGSINQPVYFHQFIEHGGRHGLQYLSEAEITEMQDSGFPEQVTAMLRELEAGDFVVREQYLDFLKGRSFRQTLLCRREVLLDRQVKPDRVMNLHVASPARPSAAAGDIASPALEEFQGPKGSVIATGHPIAKAALFELGGLWPRSVPFQELLEMARSRLSREAGPAPANEGEDARLLGEFLLQSHRVGFVELHAHCPPFVTEVSERPVASALARYQAQRGNVVSTLRHTALRLEDALGQNLVRLLDGTRDRAALLGELAKLVESGVATVHRSGKPVTGVREAQEVVADELEENLKRLAHSAILAA